MAGTAIIGRAARTGRAGGTAEIAAALETGGGHQLFHLTATAFGAFDLFFGFEHNLFKLVPALPAVIFKNRHNRTFFPKLLADRFYWSIT
jgi:hypothetical protein